MKPSLKEEVSRESYSTGDHLGPLALRFGGLIFLWASPSDLMIYIPFVPFLSEVKVIYRPSGENEGSSLFPSDVSWTRSVPSGFTMNIWFAPRLPLKTSLSPFGDQEGEVLYEPSKVTRLGFDPSLSMR